MCFKTILEFPSTFIAANIFKNYFFMVRRMCVQSSLLARLAMETSGKPSTWFPLGELEGQEPILLSFPHLNLQICQPFFDLQLAATCNCFNLSGDRSRLHESLIFPWGGIACRSSYEPNHGEQISTWKKTPSNL